MKIIPAILPHSFEEITEKISSIEKFVSEVQIDICDGVFGREKTWLPDGSEMLPSGFLYEFDVMMNDWKTYIPRCVAIGAKSIIAHVDMFSENDITELVGMVSPNSIALGISVSNDKNIDFHADMIRKAKDLYPHTFIQVMGIKKIGEQGQFFDETVPERIKELKQRFGEILIQVDGSIKPETIRLVVDAGASNVVVGSYIFGRNDVAAALETLNAAVDSE
ncbi:MAG: hypothetical protein WCT07_02405 [Candidatus Paceibacterota bacterium]|jgi:ribulose-phosphate 3-epimerase